MSVNTSKPVVHLCIPQLFQPLKVWRNDFKLDVSSPLIEDLLRRFDVVEDKDVDGLEASLFNIIGLPEHQELPVAYYRSQSNMSLDGSQNSTKDQRQKLCATPIHLEVGMNDITLTDVINDLTEKELDEILEALNKHFIQDGLAFIQESNQNCYLVLPNSEDIHSVPLRNVLRKNIAHFQPHSTSRNWRVIQNESQMILHGCEVNQQREMAGLPTVNSFWFWGGGSPMGDINSDIVDVYYANKTSESDAKMIASAVGCHCSALSESETKLPQQFNAGKTLIILDNLFEPAINDNLDVYQQALTQLETLLQPITQAWKSGKVEILIDSCNGKILKPLKPKAWKFWDNHMYPSILSW